MKAQASEKTTNAGRPPLRTIVLSDGVSVRTGIGSRCGCGAAISPFAWHKPDGSLMWLCENQHDVIVCETIR
jgi:hypothetical protein